MTSLVSLSCPCSTSFSFRRPCIDATSLKSPSTKKKNPQASDETYPKFLHAPIFFCLCVTLCSLSPSGIKDAAFFMALSLPQNMTSIFTHLYCFYIRFPNETAEITNFFFNSLSLLISPCHHLPDPFPVSRFYQAFRADGAHGPVRGHLAALGDVQPRLLPQLRAAAVHNVWRKAVKKNKKKKSDLSYLFLSSFPFTPVFLH